MRRKEEYVVVEPSHRYEVVRRMVKLDVFESRCMLSLLAGTVRSTGEKKKIKLGETKSWL